MLESNLADLLKGKVKAMLGITGTEKLSSTSDDIWSTYFTLRREFPDWLEEFYEMAGMGAQIPRKLYLKLGINTRSKLVDLLRESEYRLYSGAGDSSGKDQLRRVLLMSRPINGKLILMAARYYAEKIKQAMLLCQSVTQFSEVGSLRREELWHDDLDFLVATQEPDRTTTWIKNLPFLYSGSKVRRRGRVKQLQLIHYSGVPIHFYIVSPAEYPFYLQFLTGPKEHNEELQARCPDYGSERFITKISEEREVYERAGVAYVEPPIRARGIEAGVPTGRLITREDIKGDLHLHSNWSDGLDGVLQMAEQGQSMGYQYMGVCDHSPLHASAGGISHDKLEEQIEFIRKCQNKVRIRLLAGCEVDIREDGSLDRPLSLLEKLDLVVASIHYPYSQDKETITKRIIRALDTGLVDILAHPTGKKSFGGPPSYHVDMEAVFKAAVRNETAVEINCFPDRDDLSAELASLARKMQVKLVINTDAHHRGQMDFMWLGVSTARRAGLTSNDVLNTRDFESFWVELKKRRLKRHHRLE
ncbi:DNA polymerase/3'-5' exonuclease PolX [Calderihabitans maritimus]|uniref:PHP domain-containing protein n=1 Tax=Calderihabitans maritimus TaxID=1246530 RepID=A0A1Z5HS79_9FIRM|nr:DNA polymerase/3'-5' exonuclease PolX [Calderihabitans maritimus]GAW92374.1 PHP domain-containing protein [Calderihabitans maritimus]